MNKIYVIPGLGADCRIYSRLELSGYDVVRVNWIPPTVTDTLTTYAQKLIDQYDIQSNSILIGNSMGGMVAIEIAKQIPIRKTILISSIKIASEASGYFKFFKNVPVQNLIPASLYGRAGSLIRFAFGKMPEEDYRLFNDMLRNTPPAFITWAITAILNWDNKVIPANVIHIVGDKDHLFDYRKATNTIVVKGGTHIMIFNKADEINVILKNVLSA